MTYDATSWAHDLAAWAIPPGIIAQATESPWIHPPVLFDIPEVIEDTPSHARAREVLPREGTVLDVGCGGGIAAFALTPPATHVIGVDHQHEMLEMFARNAAARGVSVETYFGDWPAVAADVPRADVVTSHHVAYNVGTIVPFLQALHEHARRRVVVELPVHHPLATLSGAWQHFWGLQRPTGPTPADLMSVIALLGFSASMELWSGPMRVEQDLEQAAHFTRVRLCLPPEREGEVLDYLRDHPPAVERDLATIWWDV